MHIVGMRRGKGHKGKKHEWQRPRFDQEGDIINVKPSKPRNSSKSSSHSQPLCKSRAKSKGNRRAQHHDLGADYRYHNWAPFAGGSAPKVSLDDRYNQDLGIALSLSMLEYHKEEEDSQGFEPVFEDFEEEAEMDDGVSLPEIEVSEDEGDGDGLETLVAQGAAAIGAGFAPEIDNLCGDLTGAEEASSEDDDWSWESFSVDDQEGEEDYEFVDQIREDEKWSMVSMVY